ncbi:DUF1848 domain-containing protein [Desulfatibacillum alkenivorans]|nr:DUF1848 domain-containing protein [Desulfatibacillum alkenivorans]
MKKHFKTVISASRRTDIPAFYMDWFMAGVKQGFFEVQNPFSKIMHKVPADNEAVHSIVFWSKDYSPFLRGGYGTALIDTGYHLFFLFTINSESPILEPRTPPLANRLAALKELAEQFGPEAVTWRFDPICHFATEQGPQNNLGDFVSIADAAAACGVTRCVTSFVDVYRKLVTRTKALNNFSFTPPGPERQAEILLRMQKVLQERGITLYTCCENRLEGILPEDCGILPHACINHDLLEKLYGPGLSKKQDKGQRASQGCRCMESRDIGSYSLHPCKHSCLYCYANPEGY